MAIKHCVPRRTWWQIGAARSGLTSECHFVTTGTLVSTAVTVEWSNGPQGLRDDNNNDDDDDDDDYDDDDDTADV